MSPLKGEVAAKRAEGFETRRIRELEFMVPEFVARTGGSNRVQAQPAGRSFPGKSRKIADLGRFNL